jgi:hypothetical protein
LLSRDSSPSRSKPNDVYQDQAFQLPAVEKWHISLADRTRDLEDELRYGRSKKTGTMGQIAELLRERPSTCTSCKAISRRLKIPKRIDLRVLHKELGLIKSYLYWVP